MIVKYGDNTLSAPLIANLAMKKYTTEPNALIENTDTNAKDKRNNDKVNNSDKDGKLCKDGRNESNETPTLTITVGGKAVQHSVAQRNAMARSIVSETSLGY